MGTYRRRTAACPQSPAYCTYWVRVPATGVPHVPRTVAPQVIGKGGSVLTKIKLDSGARVRISNIDEVIPMTRERVCTIVGTLPAVLLAQMLTLTLTLTPTLTLTLTLTLALALALTLTRRAAVRSRATCLATPCSATASSGWWPKVSQP